MGDVPFRYPQKSAFRQLSAGSIEDRPQKGPSCHCCKDGADGVCKQVSDELIAQSLALAGLEAAVSATYQSSASIKSATMGYGEVRSANVSASEARAFDVEALAAFAQEFPFSGDRRRYAGAGSIIRAGSRATVHRLER